MPSSLFDSDFDFTSNTFATMHTEQTLDEAISPSSLSPNTSLEAVQPLATSTAVSPGTVTPTLTSFNATAVQFAALFADLQHDHEAEVVALRGEKRTATSQLAATMLRETSLRQQLLEAKRANETATMTRTTLSKVINIRNERITELEGRVADLEKEITSLRSCNRALTTSNLNAGEKIIALNEHVASLDRSNIALATALSRLDTSLIEACTEYKALEDENVKLSLAFSATIAQTDLVVEAVRKVQRRETRQKRKRGEAWEELEDAADGLVDLQEEAQGVMRLRSVRRRVV